MRNILLALVGAVALLFVGTFGTLYFTSVPFHMVAALFSTAHINMENVSGSLATGIRIGKLSYTGDENAFDLEGFVLTYGGLWNYVFKNELYVSELGLSKLTIKAHSNERGAKTAKNDAQDKASPSKASKPSKKKIRFAKIDIENVRLDLSDSVAPIELENWKVRNLSFADGKMDFETFEVAANFGDLSLGHSAPAADSGATGLNTDLLIKVVLKPTYLKLLKVPVTFDGHFKVENGQMDHTTFALNAFDKKASLKFNDEDLLVLDVKDLDFTSFMNEGYPIQKVSLNATLGPDCTKLDTLKINQGEFQIGQGKLFAVRGPVFEPAPDGKQMQLHVVAWVENEGHKITADFTRLLPDHAQLSAKLKTDGPSSVSDSLKIELASEPKLEPDELLAQLTYAQAYSALSADDRTSLARSKTYFVFK